MALAMRGEGDVAGEAGGYVGGQDVPEVFGDHVGGDEIDLGLAADTGPAARRDGCVQVSVLSGNVREDRSFVFGSAFLRLDLLAFPNEFVGHRRVDLDVSTLPPNG